MYATVLAAVVGEGPTPLGGSSGGIPIIVGNILSVALPVGGIILFVMLVLGGIFFIASGPDPKRVAAAKNTITYAIIGVVILALAFLLIRLIAIFTGANIEQFGIYIG